VHALLPLGDVSQLTLLKENAKINGITRLKAGNPKKVAFSSDEILPSKNLNPNAGTASREWSHPYYARSSEKWRFKETIRQEKRCLIRL
jgi:hypothetical protein